MQGKAMTYSHVRLSLMKNPPAQKKPSVSFKGGKGTDMFVGISQNQIGLIKYFNIIRNSLGLDGDIKSIVFAKLLKSWLFDMRQLDGVLILEGVDSIDQVIIVNNVDIF